MKLYKKIVVYLILLTTSISGCGIAASYRVKGTARAIASSLKMGMDTTQVIDALGPPDMREAYGIQEIWFYETKRPATKVASKQERYTPIIFENNKVTSWGDRYYDNPNVQKIEADIRINR